MLMPTIGYFAGLSLESIIAGVDHWVAFGLLAFIGSKMIYDAVNKDGDEKTLDNLKLHALLTLSVATSIDALMVGFSFAFLQTAILVPVAAIGVVTFLLSFTGFFFGCHLGKLFGNKIKILGGLILIAIGLRILLEHLFF
jgi:putative Mn2+ efflux pump MntP